VFRRRYESPAHRSGDIRRAKLLPNFQTTLFAYIEHLPSESFAMKIATVVKLHPVPPLPWATEASCLRPVRHRAICAKLPPPSA
jgi:hypothetical protein